MPGAGLAPPPREHLPGRLPGHVRRRRRPTPELDAVAVTQGPGPHRLAARRACRPPRASPSSTASRSCPCTTSPATSRRRSWPTARSRCPPWRSSSPAATPACSRCRRAATTGCAARTRDDAAGRGLRQGRQAAGPGLPRGPGHRPPRPQGANDRAVEFTVARIKDGSSDFSFSGIKTAVLYHVRREGIPPVADPSNVPGEVRDLVASFQRAVVTALRAPAEAGGGGAAAAEPAADRRRGRQQPAAAGGGAARRRPWACRSSSRPSRSPPTTPP